MKLVTLIIIFVACSLFAWTAPTLAQTFPASWAGVWEFTTDEEECDSGPFVGTFVDTSSICTGEGFDLDEGIPMSCSGTITETTVDVTCSGSLEIFTDCTMTIMFETQGTRSGDTITGTERTSITYTGVGCGILEDDCTDAVFTGVRIGPEPAECSPTPVIPTTWGAIKATYE